MVSLLNSVFLTFFPLYMKFSFVADKLDKFYSNYFLHVAVRNPSVVNTITLFYSLNVIQTVSITVNKMTTAEVNGHIC